MRLRVVTALRASESSLLVSCGITWLPRPEGRLLALTPSRLARSARSERITARWSASSWAWESRRRSRLSPATMR